MAVITIHPTPAEDGWSFKVRISNGATTEHTVTMSKDAYQKLTQGKITPEECVRKAIEFLLEKESKEAIMSQFDILTIGKFFPDFEKEMRRAGFEPA